MIKRCCYKQDHGDGERSDASSSSSSDDSDSIPEVEEEEVEYGGEAVGGGNEGEAPLSPSPGSGYESEDSSENEVDGDTSGLFVDNEDEYAERGSENLLDGQLTTEVNDTESKERASSIGDKLDPNDPIKAGLASCILECKSVYKCRICPRIICLNENSVRTHLMSKRHARSKKLLGEGRLKMMLNSDGEIEEEQETHAERHARTLALAQELDSQKISGKDHQRRQKRKKKSHNGSHKGKNSTKSSVKRRRKEN